MKNREQGSTTETEVCSYQNLNWLSAESDNHHWSSSLVINREPRNLLGAELHSEGVSSERVKREIMRWLRMTRQHICCRSHRRAVRNCAIMKLRLRIPETLILHYGRFHKRIVSLNASLTTERHQNIDIQTECVLRSLTNLSCWLFSDPQWCTFKPSFIVGCLETNTEHF